MIVPAGHRVLIKAEDVDEKTRGGLYLSPTTMERRKNERVIGTIVSIGMNAWKAFDGGEPWAKEGDKIFYARYGGSTIKDPDTQEEFILLNDEDVLAVVK